MARGRISNLLRHYQESEAELLAERDALREDVREAATRLDELCKEILDLTDERDDARAEIERLRAENRAAIDAAKENK